MIFTLGNMQFYHQASPAQPHAVTTVGNDRYQYDANGNMVSRTEDGTNYTQRWNPFNKLAQVRWQREGHQCNVQFVYDGDGNRLLKIEGQAGLELTTYYAGQLFEKQFNTTARRLGDAVPTGGSGNSYAACRGRTGGVTDYGYTGQRHETSFGLMDYNARFYSPRLGRFISPDSIVPDPTTAKGFNRYMYADGNPLRYSDPSGHCPKPSGEHANANIICIAGFIPTETSTGIPGLVYFQGDNRDFMSDSPRDASRFWVWINADDGSIADFTVHETQRVTGPNGTPIGEPSSPRNSPDLNWMKELIFGSNRFSSTKNEDGRITFNYEVVCSDSICNSTLAPNGFITFTPNEYGSYNSTGVVDAFPNLEAYHWRDGSLQNDTLFQMQNFSAAERASGHATMASSIGMARPTVFSAQFNSAGHVALSYHLNVDGHSVIVRR
jgi:RHS repeat-associated protein